MDKILADAKPIREILGGSRYSVDYYQREYSWRDSQVGELLSDLTGQFLPHFDESAPQREMGGYPHYFLGSIIVSERDGELYIVDGQQRLTTLTLLLIFLRHNIGDEHQKSELARLICSYKGGQHSFNLSVPGREECMNALYNEGVIVPETRVESESVFNIASRYEYIQDNLDLEDAALWCFSEWLMHNVYLVKISTTNDRDAYSIFESMNDRGLRLTPADMLKAYLLASISDIAKRNAASMKWREVIDGLKSGSGDEDINMIKEWLRSQHADSMRQRKGKAEPKDYELIGTEFHRWVSDQKDRLGLVDGDAFYGFIVRDFAFYAKWHKQIRLYATNFDLAVRNGMLAVYANARANFTHQYPVLLAPLAIGDSEETIHRKIRIVAGYIESVIARRWWNQKATGFSAMEYNMFNLVIRKIRRKSVDELAEMLAAKLGGGASSAGARFDLEHAESSLDELREDEMELNFNTNESFGLHGQNRKQIHWLLARMTDYVGMHCGQSSKFAEYMKGGKDGYEIEHIWANRFDRDGGEFQHEHDFENYRNRIGGLLLLPKSQNSSLGDLSYSEKLDKYLRNGDNLLASSLHCGAYERNPRFKQFLGDSGLEFKPYDQFTKESLDERQALYQALAEQVWSADNLRRELDK